MHGRDPRPFGSSPGMRLGSSDVLLMSSSLLFLKMMVEHQWRCWGVVGGYRVGICIVTGYRRAVSRAVCLCSR